MNKISINSIPTIILLVIPAVLAGNDTISYHHQYLKYGDKGFELSSYDGNFLMQLEWRGQFRLTYPTDSDPVTLDDFDKEIISLGINRARMKVGGHSFSPWFKYYLEYELFSSNLLDFRLMAEKYTWFKMKVGQWKVQYNRERIISSGKQQTAERSILTRAFTVDRQQGFSVYGNLDGSGIANFNYWVSVFTGTGRGSKTNDDNHMMWMCRLQWNFNGRVLKFSGSDIENHQQFTGLLAFGAVTNQSAYTRFSQSGGGQLPRYDTGVPGQYKIKQLLQESAGKYRGFSWQQELHWKEINDQMFNTTTGMIGNLFQAGYIFNHRSDKQRGLLEVYGRQAFYYPDYSRNSEINMEYTAGINYFINRHRNKLTAETSYISAAREEKLYSGWRIRLQWDVSF